MSHSQLSEIRRLVATEIPGGVSPKGNICSERIQTEATTETSPDSAREQKQDWLGIMAVWLSGISMVVYFLSSHGIKNHIVFLMENVRKVIEKTGMGW